MSSSRFARIAIAFMLCFCIFSPTFSHFTEAEPNQTCADAQPLDADLDFLPVEVLPIEILGELARSPDGNPSGDVDFFRLRAEPGTLLRADAIAGEGTVWPFVSDPLLGLFDLDCNLVESNDDYYTVDSRIEFTVPANGEFILGVSSTPDSDFSGAYFSSFYTLRVDQPPAPISGIIGQILEAESGYPVSNEYGAYATLYRCIDHLCGETLLVASQQATREDGTFAIESGMLGSLDPGDYKLEAYAYQYESRSVGPFKVSSGKVLDLGTIQLEPTLLHFVYASECRGVIEAGVCRFAVGFYNNTDSEMTLRVWSSVEGFGETLSEVVTEFPTLPRFRNGVLGPRSYGFWNFSFRVPDIWPERVQYLCPKAWAADANSRFLDVLRADVGTFCFNRWGTFDSDW